MFNSVEFVLMFLSMFSSVTKESIQTATLLLHLAFQYNLGNAQKVLSIDFHEYEFAMNVIEPLSALAASCGYDMKKMNKEKLTKMEAYELLCAIVEPVLGKLSPTELEEISKTGSSGGEVLVLPLDEVRTLVKMWTQRARDDEERYGRFGALPALGSVGYTSASAADTSGTPASDDPGPESRSDQAVKHGLDEAPRSEMLERWSKMKMDAKTAEIILAYCNEYAAAPAKATLRRTGRVSKRQMNPNAIRRDITMESGMWEMVHEVPTEGDVLNFHQSDTTEPGVSPNTRNWRDDGIECEWSMQLGKQGDKSLPPQSLLIGLWRSQNGSTFGSPLFAISGTSRNRASPRGVSKAAWRGMPVNIDDIFGVGFQNTHQAHGIAPASDYDSQDMVMPSPPLKHNCSGFDYGLSGGCSTGSLHQVDNQGGRLNTPGSVTNEYGFGEVTMPRTPLKHDRGGFDHGLWGDRSFGSLDGASYQGGPPSRPGPSGLDSDSVVGPSISMHAPAVVAYASEDLVMPKTPLKHDRGEFDYGLWGGYSVATFNQASTSTPVVLANSTRPSMPSHRSDIEYRLHGSVYDSGNMTMPRTPLKHDRGTFGRGPWGRPSAGETRLASLEAVESGSTSIPRTPPNRNRGAFDHGLWAGRPTTSVDGTSHEAERPTSPEPAADVSRLGSTTRPGAPMSLRRVWRRRVGVRNLRAVAAAHAALEDEGGMGPTTSMLNNVLLAQREDDAMCALSDSTSEGPVDSWSALPPLVGYHERSREYRERNGSDTSRTALDSLSLLTPGASSFPTPKTSSCPTLTMEYYAGVAAGWEAMQKEKWQGGLEGEQGDMMVEPKWNVVAKVMVVAGRKLRGLLWD